MSTYNNIETNATNDSYTTEATIKVGFSSGHADAALKALNEAYAEARALIESCTAPTVAPTPDPGPIVLIDRDNDRWEEQPGGVFFMRSRSGEMYSDPYSRDAIERKWGPVREVRA